MQELYIDGVQADIDSRLSVSLNIKSNLLGDISKIAANHTYTLQLPPTAHNRDLIENADELPVSTQFPYMFHRADYYRDGLPIIQNGLAVLLSVGDSIEIAVTWGVSTPLSQFIASGATLKDLQTNAVIYYESNPTRSTWGNFLADSTYAPFYAWADFHKPLEKEADEKVVATQHPSWNASYVRPIVRVPWILNLITTQYGVSFSWQQEAQDILDRLCLPLVNDTPNDQTLSSSELTLGNWVRTGVSGFFYDISVNNSGGVFSSYDTNYAYVNTQKTITLTFDFSATTGNALASIMAESAVIQIRVTNGSETEDPEELQMRFEIVERTGSNAVVECKGTLDVELQSGQGVAIIVKTDGMLTALSGIANLMIGEEITATNQAEHVQFNSNYPISGNLPDVKIVDFLKTLCAFLGVWAKQPKGNTISFVPFSELETQSNNAPDWTRKVIPSHELERPNQTEFHISEWAQKNWLRWQDLDDYDAQDDGSINVADNTLESERDLFTIPFAPCKMNSVGMARVPIWQLDNFEELMTGDETTPTYTIEDCEPRLLMATPRRSSRFINTGDDSLKGVMLTMAGLKFNEVIANRYTTLSRLLNEARVITERMRLDDADLLEFDESVPVYLSQYGGVFAVLEISADSNGTADVKMIKL